MNEDVCLVCDLDIFTPIFLLYQRVCVGDWAILLRAAAMDSIADKGSSSNWVESLSHHHMRNTKNVQLPRIAPPGESEEPQRMAACEYCYASHLGFYKGDVLSTTGAKASVWDRLAPVVLEHRPHVNLGNINANLHMHNNWSVVQFMHSLFETIRLSPRVVDTTLI